MLQSEIDNAIYEKYIKPTKADRKRCAGIEIEMPVVNLSEKPVEEAVTIEIAKKFGEHFGFEPQGYDADKNVNSYIKKDNGDDLSFDCAYSNIELSMGKGENLFEIKNRFEKYYQWLNEQLGEKNYTLTGMGINPNYNINHNKPIPNERYRMLFHYLHTYENHKGEPNRYFHNRPDFGTFTSASQVQLDVYYDSLIDTINTFGKLEPYKALLFANSYMSEYPDLMCARNMLWEHSMQGYNPHNVGMFGSELKNIDELLEYIKSTSIYCTMRNGKYVNFTPVPISNFLKREKVEGEYFDGEKYQKIEITPCVEDLQYLRSFKFEDLTYRGTIEFRSSCCQPVKDSFTVSAFHIGLIENLDKLKNLLDNDSIIYTHGYSADEMKKTLSMREIPEFINKSDLKSRLIEILDLSSEGLDRRGYGEKILLNPLYERAERLTNPAKEMVKGLESGKTMDYYIKEYGKL